MSKTFVVQLDDDENIIGDDASLPLPCSISRCCLSTGAGARPGGRGKNYVIRSASLWKSDAALLCLEHLQLLALTLSMSLAWPWPLEWITGAGFLLIANGDLWEMTKIYSGVYRGQAHASEDPNAIPLDYLAYSIAWMVLTVGVPLLAGSLYLSLPRLFPATLDMARGGGIMRASASLMRVELLRAKLVRALLLWAQAIATPLGLVMVRLLDCRDYPAPGGAEGTTSRSVVLRETACWSGAHLGLLVPMAAISACYLLLVPVWMLYTIKKELISPRPTVCCCRGRALHETFLRLKEAEYERNIDTTWATHHYAIFSSFQRPWVCFRPCSFFFKAGMLLIYGVLFYSLWYQALFAFIKIAVISLVFLVAPVYRIISFHVMLVFSAVASLCNVTLGLLLTLGAQNALLVGRNLLYALLLINGGWLLVAVIWLASLFLKSSGCCVSKKRFWCGPPLWPKLSELDLTSSGHSDLTEKFVRAILRGRHTLEQCYILPRLFTPVHQLSHDILVVNAYYREAELVSDPMEGSLWALLAEMIDVHTVLLKHSLFATSTKYSVSRCAEELMELLPSLRQRLEKREYDLALWTPRKRRMLLKMTALVAFLAASSTKHSKEGGEESASDYSVLPVVYVGTGWQEGGGRQHEAGQGGGGGVGGRKGSEFSFLQDDSEETNNDSFLRTIDQWEVARRASMDVSPRAAHTSSARSKASVRFTLDTISGSMSDRPSSALSTVSSTDRLIQSINEKF